ncbi:roundabout homolog 1-like [Tigriopus californicus]|nr:roundabout homolog 1-like [Tigriopus californicus]
MAFLTWPSKGVLAFDSDSSSADEIDIMTVEGGRAELPCNILAPTPGDSVYLVLWYRKESPTPIYSFDSRKGQDEPGSDRPDLWSEPTAFGDRAHFRVSTSPAMLSVTGVQRFDKGTYICRVDFRQSPTMYHNINLDVIVPPQKPLIIDDRGQQVEGDVGIGPFREGESLSLECNVPGGRPLPSVYWYLNDQLIDGTYQQTYERTIKNGLYIERLKREHTQGRLRCLASNNNITRPVETSVQLKMLFPPQGAKIEMPNHPLTAGREYAIACQVWGSNPPARIEWHRGASQDLRPLNAYNQTYLDGGNVTVSWIRLIPEPNFHLQTLTCRGSNEELLTATSQIVEDYKRLEVFFAPTVELSLGRMVNPTDLEEGDDIYFSCSIKANPPAYKLTWWHNGEEVVHDLSNGIIISNQSLVLQKVTRKQAGSYTCEASNVEGDQVSKPVVVTIMYKPICLQDQKTIYGVSEGETAHISCRVDAYPEADVFSWSFNTSSGGMDLSRDSYTNQGSASLLSYVPKSQMDYGTVLCRAGNLVGRQVVPCVFHVIPAGPPDPPKNCTLTNQTQDSLQVDCREGFSSGLKQEFHMEVFTLPEHQLVVNITARSPKLLARGLPPDSTLFLRVYASTAKGRSRSVTFEGYTLHMADKQTVVHGSSQAELETRPKDDQWPLMTVVLLGVALTLLVIIFVIGFIARIGKRIPPSSTHHHGSHLHHHPHHKGGPGGSNDIMLRHRGDTLINKAFQDVGSDQQSTHMMEIDKSPDVIPHFNGPVSPPPSTIDGQGSFSDETMLNNRLHPYNNANGNPDPSIKLMGGDPMTKLYNYSNGTKNVNSFQNQKQDNLLRSSNLYSPAGTSDSSGFSERDSTGGFGLTGPNERNMYTLPAHSALRVPLNNATQASHNFAPGHLSHETSGVLHGGRVGSPSYFSYHNPTLMASPYSTLPRRMPNGTNEFSTVNSISGNRGRNSPLLNIVEHSMDTFHTGSLQRNVSMLSPSIVGTTSSTKSNKLATKAALLKPDDRESCV